MPVGDIFEVGIVCAVNTQTSVNVRHYKQTVGADDIGGTRVAAAISSIVNLPYKSLLAGNATFRGVYARRIRPAPAGVPGSTTANAGPGSSLGDTMPTQVCGLISLRSVLTTRRGRGRLYMPFPSEAVNGLTSTPDAGYLTALNTLAIALLGNASVIPVGGDSGATLQPGVFSKTGDQFNALTQTITRSLWATQRRRSAISGADALLL